MASPQVPVGSAGVAGSRASALRLLDRITGKCNFCAVKLGQIRMQYRQDTSRLVPRIVAVLLAVFLPSGEAQAQEKPVWNIKAEQLDCLRQNLNGYLATEQDPVVIFLSACPETDLVKIMASTSQNMAVADVEVVQDSANAPAEVVSFTRTELACLSEFIPDGGGPVVQVPRDPCK